MGNNLLPPQDYFFAVCEGENVPIERLAIISRQLCWRQLSIKTPEAIYRGGFRIRSGFPYDGDEPAQCLQADLWVTNSAIAAIPTTA